MIRVLGIKCSPLHLVPEWAVPIEERRRRLDIGRTALCSLARLNPEWWRTASALAMPPEDWPLLRVRLEAALAELELAVGAPARDAGAVSRGKENPLE